MCNKYKGIAVGDRVAITRKESVSHLTAGDIPTSGFVVSIDKGRMVGKHLRPIEIRLENGDLPILATYDKSEIKRLGRGIVVVHALLETPYLWGEPTEFIFCTECAERRGMFKKGHKWMHYKVSHIEGVQSGRCGNVGCDFEID